MAALDKPKVIIVGAGIFSLSTAYYLAEDGYDDITIFDQHAYNSKDGYKLNPNSTAASVDENKVFRASYGDELYYQRLAYEAREVWKAWNDELGPNKELFVESGMLRVQHSTQLDDLERKTLANMTAEGLRDTQYILTDEEDRHRAAENGWAHKLLQFAIPESGGKETFEAVLDTTAGYVYPSKACTFLADKLRKKGARFVEGPDEGVFASLQVIDLGGSKRVVGIVTKDGQSHPADLVIVACGSATSMLVPEVSAVLEATAGSVVTVRLPPKDQAPQLWDKYSHDKWPVIIAHDPDPTGKNVASRSVYSFPRTEDGLVKIGYRVTKYTNYVKLPGFKRPISVPLRPSVDDTSIPLKSIEGIKTFVSTFLPDLAALPIAVTRLCFYTDSVDNSFLIDYLPGYNDSLFICTGGSGHGAKFTPILGKHVRDIIQKKPKTVLTYHWRWRPELPLGNGLEEGPDGPRTLDKQQRATPEDLRRAGW
ncbi:FAD dependent oxidoreductase [Laetiporus sulphureus 93-53]|uniref:FAD dependent oxidoreductase n=1 Tax=Laetiporus sulphureus 93-53 TaxID=1314785 RepID=A0A165IC13_9APHY|nr:FAD dependent oxidoreductase [Laetiporus sulphureus 93-53]KZT12872.1 FAD dependent oxidoreductase [Laetiporus sulphureus 93-53]